MPTTLLDIAELTVTFDGFRAVDGVDLSIAEGELRFLIGPNGAGKTTVLDAVTGLCRASGSARFAGEELVGLRPHRIVRRGVGRTFQTPAVFDELSVLENVDLAASWRVRLPGLLRRRTLVAPTVADALEVVDLAGRLALPAGALSHGQRRWLEIAMLLAQDPRLLLLDEPVAGMTRVERERTGQLLQRIVEDRTVVIIEHDMDFLRRFARRVTVLHEGRVLSEGTVDEVQTDERVQEVYLGRAREDVPIQPVNPAQEATC
jgi:urea transport system ATP-binding protein